MVTDFLRKFYLICAVRILYSIFAFHAEKKTFSIVGDKLNISKTLRNIGHKPKISIFLKSKNTKEKARNPYEY